VERRDGSEEEGHRADLTPLREEQPSGEHALHLVPVERALRHHQNDERRTHTVNDPDQSLLGQACLGGPGHREDHGTRQREAEGSQIGCEGIRVAGEQVPDSRAECGELH
jgi:hypothetical protein